MNAPLNNPISNYPLLIKNMKIFGKFLQMLAQDYNRPLGLRYGRLMMMMIGVELLILKRESNSMKLNWLLQH
jgi:hypothetical protein